MQDQHNHLLRFFYKSCIEKTKQYLKGKYSIVTYNLDEKDEEISEIPKSEDLAEIWQLKYKGTSRNFTFLIFVPQTFPDTFPKIYLSKKDYKEIYPIPHLDRNRFVCTRDPEVVVLNENKPEEALEELLKQAVIILENGIDKKNEKDYKEEFLAYWNRGHLPKILSLFSPQDKILHLKIVILSKKLFRAEAILYESEEVLKNWLLPFNVEIKEEFKALYLPLPDFLGFNFEKNREVLKILKNSGPENLRALENYINQNQSPCFIISSFPIRDERVLFGWKQEISKGSIKGFREESYIPLEVRLLHTAEDLIEKIEMVRMDKKRLFKRGGTGLLLPVENSMIAMIGCGSVGSFLTMSLSKCGIDKFLLVDKQTLEPENVARHLCGLVDASKEIDKATAVKERLAEHFPFVKSKIFFDDILNLLMKYGAELFNGCNLIVVSLANMAAERRINYLQRKESINLPIVYVWMEPYGVAGHVLFVHRYNGGCYDCCFDEKGIFIYSVIEKREELFKKREAGCQSTFLPYSGLDTEHFGCVAAKIILQILEGKVNTSTLYTWLGDFNNPVSSGLIKEMYITDFPYTVFPRNIHPQRMCKICEKKK